MKIEREVVVIGGGPSGLSAAIEASKAGAEVLLIDENLRAGGQLFKQIHKFFGSSAHYSGTRGFDIGEKLLNEARKYSVEIYLNSVAIGIFKENIIAIKKGYDYNKKELITVKAQRIVIATGASENAISFPGWTLPGVMGAGAVQTMINVNRVLPGKRILIIGSGNVGLIVTYQLLQAGAEVLAVVEAAPQISGYQVHAAKIIRAGVPVYTSSTILKASGKNRIEQAMLCKLDKNWKKIKGTEFALDVDTIAIAVGLKPAIKLVRMSGCECVYNKDLSGWIPLHNEKMESTIKGIYIVGDTTGVEEANTALEEGKLAGIAIAESLKYLPSTKAHELINETWERLKDLRMGPFGEKRMSAKKEIFSEYHKYVNQQRGLSCAKKEN